MPAPIQHTQMTLFEQQAAAPLPGYVTAPVAVPQLDNSRYCSELTLAGRAEHCLHLLAPVLKLLSEHEEQRWLTLVSPPAMLTMQWLRDAGLNPQRTLILHPKGLQSSLELTCQVLELGRSHTTISWVQHLSNSARHRLAQAAEQGNTQSINIVHQFSQILN